MSRRHGLISRYFARRPRLKNWLLGILLAIYPVVGIFTASQWGPHWLRLLAAVIALEAAEIGIVLWGRNRTPIIAYIVVLAADILLLVMQALWIPENAVIGTFAFFVVMYALAKWKSHRLVWTLAVFAVLVSSLGFTYVLVEKSQKSLDLTIILQIAVLALFTFIMYFVAIVLGFRARRSRLLERDVQVWAAQQSKAAQLEERARIAREMHDVVAHSLTVMVALADGAVIAGRRDPAKAAEVMAQVSSTGRSALVDMRRVLGVLKADDDAEAPRTPLAAMETLRDMIDGFSTAGLPVTLVTGGERLPEDPILLQAVHRIVQESLTNALRYATRATEVVVELSSCPGEFHVKISDNSGEGPEIPARSVPGFQGARTGGVLGTGNGIAGLRTRVEALGGTFTAGPGAFAGWIVEATLPLKSGPRGPIAPKLR